MRIVFIGSGEIGLPTLEWLRREQQLAAVVTQPDKPAGRNRALTPTPVRRFALDHGIPSLQPRRLREPSAVAELAAFAPEVLVVMAYGQILSPAVLALPTRACLNLHASLLPKYRGAAPIQAAIEAGERETGLTVMWMNEGLDTGDVLLERPIPIRRRETGGSLHDRLALLGPGALADALALLAEGRAPRLPQDDSAATYAARLSRESGEIDWHAPAAAIDRRVRAMNPWPAASTTLPASDAPGLGAPPPRRLKVFSVIQVRQVSGEPGVVLRADRRGLLVGAGEGAVLLREVQMEGKRRMTAGELLLGHPVAPGTRLGPR